MREQLIESLSNLIEKSLLDKSVLLGKIKEFKQKDKITEYDVTVLLAKLYPDKTQEELNIILAEVDIPIPIEEKINLLYTENTNLMVAITEVYELLLGGM